MCFTLGLPLPWLAHVPAHLHTRLLSTNSRAPLPPPCPPSLTVVPTRPPGAGVAQHPGKVYRKMLPRTADDMLDFANRLITINLAASDFWPPSVLQALQRAHTAAPASASPAAGGSASQSRKRSADAAELASDDTPP